MRSVRVTTTRLVCQSVALVVLLICAAISGTPAVIDAQSPRDVTVEHGGQRDHGGPPWEAVHLAPHDRAQRHRPRRLPVVRVRVRVS